jgi:hypothetical protein
MNVAETGKQVLDTPFHFLLELPDYPPEHLTNDSDMTSAWGHVVLARKGAGTIGVLAVRATLLEAARRAGWTPTDEVADIEQPDLTQYGMAKSKEDLTLMLTKGDKKQNPPTRYGCRVWIAPDGRRVVVAYRVDGE